MSQKLIRYGYKTPRGKTIRELIWEQLDDAMDALMSTGKPMWEEIGMADPDRIAETFRRYGHEQGVAQATAYVLSLFEQPDHPDIDSVRGAAVLRYKERQQLKELKTVEEVVEVVEENAARHDGGDSNEDADGADAARAGQAHEG